MRTLRVAILSGNTLVEERLVRGRGDVTLGPSPRDTFVVAADPALPRSVTLFAATPSGWELRFTRRMAGRVALDEKMAPLPLDDLAATATRHGEIYRLPLGDRARGTITIGDLTVLYQLVAPPPQLPRPRLPPSLRGSIFRNLDGMMIALCGLSFVAHTAFCAYLRTIDLPRTPDIERIPDRVVQSAIYLPHRIDPPTPAPVRVDPNRPLTDGNAGRAHHHPPVAATGITRAQLAAQVSRTGLMNVIGARGENGLFADLIRPDPGSDGDQVFRDIGGVRVGGEVSSLHSLRNGGAPSVRGIAALRVRGPGQVDLGTTDERVAPKGEWIPRTPIDTTDPTLVPVVTGEITKRKRAIGACYERAMVGTPSLAGKLELRFHLSALGKVVGTTIESDTVGDEGLRRCITTMVATWRFPPMREAAEFSYPFIFQPVH